MPITILDYVKSKAGEKDSYSGEDFLRHGVEMLGGCEVCQATIAAYNAYPSKSGYWRCANCIGDTGFDTAEEFIKDEAKTDRAVGWLQRLRQLQADGMGFAAALTQANAETDGELTVEIYDPKAIDDLREYADDSDDQWATCPSCGRLDSVVEIWAGRFKCDECDAEWTL
jgi:ribosomal protein L37AE/L43A